MKQIRLHSIIILLLIKTLAFSQSNELREKEFDIERVISNSTSLSQIMAKINFSFEQFGEKTKSGDGNFITVRYKNSSLITSLVTYSSQGDVTQIIFLMPKNNSDSIGKNLIRSYGTKIINGEEVITKGNLTYDIRSDGDIGIFVIK